jgi:integrase
MASIEQRGNSWRVYWRNGGRSGPKESCTWSDEETALRAKAIAEAHGHRITADTVIEAILGPQQDEKPASTLPTVREWADIWLNAKTRISPGQRGRYRQQLDDRILPVIGDLHLDEVGGRHISDLINKLREAGLQESTVTRYYSCVHAIFAYAVIEKKIDDNPAKRTDFIRDLIANDDTDQEGADHVYLTHADYALIRSHLNPLARPLADYLIGTGARFGEATAAEVRSIDRGKRQARIHAAWKRDDVGHWYRGPTKGRRKRSVAVGVKLLEALKAQLSRGPTELLFTAPGGGRWDNSNFINRYWEPAVAAAMRCSNHPPPAPPKPKRGPTRAWRPDEVSTCDCAGVLKQRPTPHDLRHTHTAWLIAAGHHLSVISRRLGHFSTVITERIYAGILPELNTAVADSVDDAMAEAYKSAA